MADQPTVNVTVTHRFTASAERVFDAWIDPAKAGKWLFSTPDGTIVKIEIDARVGGKFLVVDRRDGVDVDHVGEYVEIDRPRRLVFKFVVPKYTDHWTTVAIDIASFDDGCELTLTHKGVLTEYADRTTGGWTMMLEGLDEAVG